MNQESGNNTRKKYNVAIVGATGLVGRKTGEILVERNFPLRDCVAIASDRQYLKSASFGDMTVPLKKIDEVDFSKYDITFLCVPDSVSQKYAERIANCGSVVIDKSAHFRLDPRVPLIVPEINKDLLAKGASLGIVAGPNCIAGPLCIALKPLSVISPIKRVVVSTYQSVSGAGVHALNELYAQTDGIMRGQKQYKEKCAKALPELIGFNVIPSIGSIDSEGFSNEEKKICDETRKILKSGIKMTVTCVRVPVFVGHCMSITCEFEETVTEEQAFEAFNNSEGVVTLDRRSGEGTFITPLYVEGEDAVFVSRIRKDYSVKSGLMLWIAADNLRKGAALNSVQIAEEMVKMDSDLKKWKKIP